MISYNSQQITGIFYNKIPMAYLYRGSVLVWEAVNSCFGSGYWKNDLSWKNDDAWKNNK